jgi:hypothetical protein
MRSIEAVLPLSGRIGIFVRVTTVMSPAIGGRRVGCGVGVGTVDPDELAAADVVDGDGSGGGTARSDQDHPRGQIANPPAPNRTPIVVPPAFSSPNNMPRGPLTTATSGPKGDRRYSRGMGLHYGHRSKGFRRGGPSP